MIVDGRISAPEEALRQLRECQQRDRLGEPMPPIVGGVADLIEVPRKKL
jgi:hypothetical protein